MQRQTPTGYLYEVYVPETTDDNQIIIPFHRSSGLTNKSTFLMEFLIIMRSQQMYYHH